MSEFAAPLIDSHTHLDDQVFDADRSEVLARARTAGVQGFLNIAYKPEIWDTSVALRDTHPDVEFAAGLHPQDSGIFHVNQADALAERLLALRPRAIGEAGFDFARPGPSHPQQLVAFQWQIELAVATGLPLIIHQREAGEQLVEELDRWPQLHTVVLHSFDGDERLAAWTVERGFFVGIGGLACRPNSRELRRALQLLPVEKLLLETDSPYLAPNRANSRRNEPANLRLIAQELAPLWDLTPNTLSKHTTVNAQSIFGFPQST